jgi:Fur family ferric uptake transcriptional regulator
MTHPNPGPSLAAPDLDSAIAALRSRGLRVSSARRLVLEALYQSETPISAEQIADGLSGRLPRSDLASVYRNLETLEAIGIVRHVHLGHGPGRYALSARSGGWATCEVCKRSTALTPAALDRIRDAVREAAGYDAGFSHFPIVGRCTDCRAA